MKPAEIILKDCLGVKPHEKVLIITDKERLDIAKDILEQAKKISDAKLIEIPVGKVAGEEPPEQLAKEMPEYDVIIAPTTKSLTHTNALKVACFSGARAATLPGITKDMLERAIPIDYNVMATETNKIADILNKGKQVHITTKAGTDIKFSIENRTTKPDTGMLKGPGIYGNLPAGEAFLAPVENTANGKIVFDASMIGKIKTPITVEVEDGFVVKIQGKEEAEELKKVLESIKDKNAYNIAELGIGTNPKAIISGNVLEDEKVKGTAHIAVGKNSSFGGKIDVPIHLDGIFENPTISVDGKTIIQDGEFLV